MKCRSDAFFISCGFHVMFSEGIRWTEINWNKTPSLLLSSSSSSSLEFYSLSFLINLKRPLFFFFFFTFYKNSISLNGWFQMAECECFELTLLNCEWVCGPGNGHPLQHMGCRFTPLHLKTPLNPDGHRPTLLRAGWETEPLLHSLNTCKKYVIWKFSSVAARIYLYSYTAC